jgi:hypothetical protein
MYKIYVEEDFIMEVETREQVDIEVAKLRDSGVMPYQTFVVAPESENL